MLPFLSGERLIDTRFLSISSNIPLVTVAKASVILAPEI